MSFRFILLSIIVIKLGNYSFSESFSETIEHSLNSEHYEFLVGELIIKKRITEPEKDSASVIIVKNSKVLDDLAGANSDTSLIFCKEEDVTYRPKIDSYIHKPSGRIGVIYEYVVIDFNSYGIILREIIKDGARSGTTRIIIIRKHYRNGWHISAIDDESVW